MLHRPIETTDHSGHGAPRAEQPDFATSHIMVGLLDATRAVNMGKGRVRADELQAELILRDEIEKIIHT